MKLDPVKVEWVVRQKEKGASNRRIADSVRVSCRRVQELWSEYRRTGAVPVLKRPGRRRVEPSEEEMRVVARAYARYRRGALILERVIAVIYGASIPHNRIHRVLKSMGLARDEPRKQERRKWVRFERRYSNSMWHTDWTFIEGREGWLIAYLDDASRFVTGWGLFPEATSQHSVDVLKEAIRRHGKPASILTDRGIQFYANESEEREKGATVFERFLVGNRIRQVLSRVMHPQTNGKVERFFRTVKEKLNEFDTMKELVWWYNEVRPHMSLNLDVIETPHQAFVRKMPEPGTTVVDKESGEVYRAQKE
jgi:putative transposase